MGVTMYNILFHSMLANVLFDFRIWLTPQLLSPRLVFPLRYRGHKTHSFLVSISSEDFSQLMTRMDKIQLALDLIVSEKSETIGRKLFIEDVDETAAVNWSKITNCSCRFD